MAIDANTGRVLYDSHGDELRYPASLTKMMTLYMMFDLIEQGRLGLKSRMSVSAQAAAQPPSKLGLKVGEKIRVIDAIKALVTKSANDVAVVIAEHIAGSERNFARLMTRKARSLGMKKTVFRNASGLPDSGQVSTARDMLRLAMALQDNHPRHYRFFRTRAFTFRGKRYRNHNTLLGRVDGVDGIKTGYIRAAGFNLVSSVRRDGKHVVAAVFGGKSAKVRNARMRGIIARTLKKASTKRTRKARPNLIARPRVIPRPKRPPPANPLRVANKRKAAPQRAVRVSPPPPRPIARVAPDVGRADAPPASVAGPDSRIEIAQVRRVDVLGSKNARAVSTERAPPRPASPPELRPSHAPRPFAGSPPQVTQPPRGQRAVARHNETRAPGREPGTLQGQLAAIWANSGAADNTPVAREPGRRASPPPARQIDRRATQRQPAPTVAARPFLIQVGAYRSRVEAEEQLATVAQRAEQLLGAYERRTEMVDAGSRTLYRARFAGFDAQDAAQTCNELRRRAIDCFVTRSR